MAIGIIDLQEIYFLLFHTFDINDVVCSLVNQKLQIYSSAENL